MSYLGAKSLVSNNLNRREDDTLWNTVSDVAEETQGTDVNHAVVTLQ